MALVLPKSLTLQTRRLNTFNRLPDELQARNNIKVSVCVSICAQNAGRLFMMHSLEQQPCLDLIICLLVFLTKNDPNHIKWEINV